MSQERERSTVSNEETAITQQKSKDRIKTATKLKSSDLRADYE